MSKVVNGSVKRRISEKGRKDGWIGMIKNDGKNLKFRKRKINEEQTGGLIKYSNQDQVRWL